MSKKLLKCYGCIPAFLYTYIPVYLYTGPAVYLYTPIPVHLYTCIPVYLYTCIPVYLYTCMCVFSTSFDLLPAFLPVLGPWPPESPPARVSSDVVPALPAQAKLSASFTYTCQPDLLSGFLPDVVPALLAQASLSASCSPSCKSDMLSASWQILFTPKLLAMRWCFPVPS